MNKPLSMFNHWGMIAVTTLLIFACKSNVVVLENHSGDSKAPISIQVDLSKNELKAAQENKLALIEDTDHGENKEIAVQLDERNLHLVTILPEGQSGKRKFKLIIRKTPNVLKMKAKEKPVSQQPILSEDDQIILQYNYHTVHANEVIRPGGKIKELEFSPMSSGKYYEEYLKSHPTFPKDTVVSSAVYSVPRSDYIHPLYGINGEILTNDWPDGGHPHHRGIFWAWPEVEYNGERGDIYALQRIFARPTGNIEFIEGPVYAQVNAENQWMWEEKKPIVMEHASIRAYRSTSDTRIIDLRLEFLALEKGVTIATRFTNSYGGLNIRMQTPENQEINYFKGKTQADPIKTWGDFSGIFEGSDEESGMMVLQHQSNPEYPGKWVKYPVLSWIQPTFPTPETRFPLSTTKPLMLKYRFVVHKGGTPDDHVSEAFWDAFNSENAPELD